MTKHSLRPIAICVMLFGALPLVAPQGLSAQTTQNARGTVEGKAVDAKGKPVPNSTVQLRDAKTGQVVATATPTAAGAYSFSAVAGTYVVEVVGASGAVIATSGALAVTAGATVAATVTVSAAVGAAAAAGTAAGAASILGMSAPIAAVVMGSAAAAGILAVSSDDCVSPPCQ